ncbi:hypothetical protein ACA910_020937 [Epithemia clementina (nom. ined.)]
MILLAALSTNALLVIFFCGSVKGFTSHAVGYSPTNVLLWHQTKRSSLTSSALSSSSTDGYGSSSSTGVPTLEDLDDAKARLVRTCGRSSPKPSLSEIQGLVEELETMAEQLSVGQASSISGLLNGEWELLYSPEDATRSSPFFWAFRKALPDSADQIFGITDAIPAPIKEIGPAFQQIEISTNSQTGRFVSRVKVATLGGLATSIMTTRASIVGIVGLDGIRIKIDTTKPEDSTVVKTLLGPLGDVVSENIPPFPSGEALERIMPGSSEVILKTTFCDEGLRISRDGDRLEDIYVWRRREFASFDFL